MAAKFRMYAPPGWSLRNTGPFLAGIIVGAVFGWILAISLHNGGLATTSTPGVLRTVEAPALAPVDASSLGLPTPETMSPALGAPLTIAGRGSTKTAPIELRGGNYVVHWEATEDPPRPGGPQQSSGCFHVAYLVPISGDESAEQDVGDGPVGPSIQRPAVGGGETHVYGLPSGAYYIDATETGCYSWSITLSPM